MKKFKGRVVLITGASSGIGEALAREFARQGAHLALLARRVDRLKILADELRVTGCLVLPLACDVTRDGDLEKAVARVRQECGKIDVVVANAGFGVVGDVLDLTLEDYRRQFETNIYGVLRTVYTTLNDLKKSRGRLAIIGSVSGHISTPGTSAYSMSKHAVRSLAESLYLELWPDGVSTTLISPGFVATEIRKVDNHGDSHPEVADGVPAWLCMSPQKAARQIVRAIRKKKREVVITFHGKVAVFFYRHFPRLVVEVMKLSHIRGRAEPR